MSNLSRRLFPIHLLALCIALIAPKALRGESPAVQTVGLIIDYGDGVEKRFTKLPWTKDMTAFDAMNLAQSGPHPIKYQYDHPAGPETYFLTEIDGVKNEGAGADKRNWLYWVNDTFGDRSFAVWKLQPSDIVTWRFSLWPYKN